MVDRSPSTRKAGSLPPVWPTPSCSPPETSPNSALVPGTRSSLPRRGCRPRLQRSSATSSAFCRRLAPRPNRPAVVPVILSSSRPIAVARRSEKPSLDAQTTGLLPFQPACRQPGDVVGRSRVQCVGAASVVPASWLALLPAPQERPDHRRSRSDQLRGRLFPTAARSDALRRWRPSLEPGSRACQLGPGLASNARRGAVVSRHRSGRIGRDISAVRPPLPHRDSPL